MSFGFSVGDFLAGANLAYTLYQSLSESNGAREQYVELINELNVVHKVLIQVDELRSQNRFAQATMNSISLLTSGMNEAMVSFLTTLDKYTECLRAEGSGNRLKDIIMKGKWVLSMPDEVQKLRSVLHTNLMSLNILIQLACYYNTGYDPQISARLGINEFKNHESPLWTSFPNVKKEAVVDCWATFRASPRQVFIVHIEAKLYLQRHKPGNVDWDNLPLEPISSLKERQNDQFELGRQRRLAQLTKLPLNKMFQYAKLKDDGMVECGPCVDAGTKSFSFKKEFWIDNHFRINHHKIYEQIRVSLRTAENSDTKETADARWIALEDIETDEPILSSMEINHMLAHVTSTPDPWAGIIVAQRFVVVREGTKSCLCLGIHTYAGRGCSDQVDQDLFAILHSSKEVPEPLEAETRMTLKPVRMKADHPSMALPKSARIHFGRVYEVYHDAAVREIGLVHDSSMEGLISQFEARCPMELCSSEREEVQTRDNVGNITADDIIMPVDMDVARGMRESIQSAVGDTKAPSVPWRRLLNAGVRWGAQEGGNAFYVFRNYRDSRVRISVTTSEAEGC
ncbi:hypothetical protein CNMCM5623_000981 [Aspergillus felis]|uniref:DUF6590 domain-containing protein n=1 Tax=Aspergillus felis TaxID=1287682 RepID=A0A8H6QWW5_9EURO|nr:hypothetical protein CNMCM5623_000981 [Aspergillus felis]KAF7180244.1 hypothetical protein CNMCM7691_009411 [Aspergillus felis]